MKQPLLWDDYLGTQNGYDRGFSTFGSPKQGEGTPRAAQKGRFLYGLLIGAVMEHGDVSDTDCGKEADKAVRVRLFDHV